MGMDDQTQQDNVVQELAPYYEYVKELGQGTFGRVVLAKDVRLNNRPVAVKLIQRGSFIGDFRVYVAREIVHHGSLMHPLVIGCYEAFLTPKYLCIAMEWAPGGDLFHFLNRQPGTRFSEPVARLFFQQIMIALHYIHQRGVANRDLKLENLLLDSLPGDGTSSPFIKVCDFGYSKHEFNSSAQSRVGTPIYMSPEVIQGGNTYNPFIADIWSAGVVLYVLLTGNYPFNKDAEPTALARQVMQGRWNPINPEFGVSAVAQDLVARMLSPMPQNRPTLDEIMQNPWFKEGLPAGTLEVNAYWIDCAPKADQPPLSEVPTILNEMLERGRLPGEPGEPRVACEFPCRAKLRAELEGAVRNASTGATPAQSETATSAQGGGASQQSLGDVFGRLVMQSSAELSQNKSHTASVASLQ